MGRAKGISLYDTEWMNPFSPASIPQRHNEDIRFRREVDDDHAANQ